MDDRLKAALEEGAKNGASEVFAKHEEYVAKLKDAEDAYKNAVHELETEFVENEKQYEFAQSILNGIINKLDKKEQ